MLLSSVKAKYITVTELRLKDTLFVQLMQNAAFFCQLLFKGLDLLLDF